MNMIPACRFQASDGHIVFGDPPERTGGAYASHAPGDDGTPEDFGGLPGLFSEVTSASGNQICSDRNSNYSGSPQQIIEEAFPFFKPKDGSGIRNLPPEEVFAEIYSAQVAFPDTVNNSGAMVDGNDNIFIQPISQPSGLFACTSLYVRTWTQDGRAPTATELRNTVYSVPGIIGSGPDAGLRGYGSTNYSCDGTSEYQGDYGFGS